MAGEKKALTKDEKADILWKLEYVMNSIKIYGTSETFDRPFYIMHLKGALDILEGEEK